MSAGGEFDVEPRWTKGGREIVFRRWNAAYAVDIDVGTGRVGAERKLFERPHPVERGYDVTPEGTRFLMVKVEDRQGPSPTATASSGTRTEARPCQERLARLPVIRPR